MNRTVTFAAGLILVWIIGYIDRFIINYYINPSEVGIYDLSVKFTLFIDFIQMGLAAAITPRILTIWKDKGIPESNKEVNLQLWIWP